MKRPRTCNAAVDHACSLDPESHLAGEMDSVVMDSVVMDSVVMDSVVMDSVVMDSVMDSVIVKSPVG